MFICERCVLNLQNGIPYFCIVKWGQTSSSHKTGCKHRSLKRHLSRLVSHEHCAFMFEIPWSFRFHCSILNRAFPVLNQVAPVLNWQQERPDQHRWPSGANGFWHLRLWKLYTDWWALSNQNTLCLLLLNLFPAIYESNEFCNLSRSRYCCVVIRAKCFLLKTKKQTKQPKPTSQK